MILADFDSLVTAYTIKKRNLKQIGVFSYFENRKNVENRSIETVICLHIEHCSVLMSQLKLKQSKLVNLVCSGSEIELKWLFTGLLVGQYEMIEKPRTNWER